MAIDADILEAPRPPLGLWGKWSSLYPSHFVGGVNAPFEFRACRLVQDGTRKKVDWEFRFAEGTANQNDTVHGGAIFAIMDSLVNTAGHYNEGCQTATARGTINFRRPVRMDKTYVASSWPAELVKRRNVDGKTKSAKPRFKYVVELREHGVDKVVARCDFVLVHWSGYKPRRSPRSAL